MTEGRLLVVDGNSLAHRAFHAMERLGTRDPDDDRPVWAVHGFLNLMISIVDRTRPDAVLVGFDDRGGSARRERYPDYKAGRAPTSPDLHPQIDEIRIVLAELGITVLSPAGLEADDVLASAAATAELAGWRCLLATSDKDSFGLITPSVNVMRLVSGLDNAVTMTPARLHEQYGVLPQQWLDYCALVGDKSDNLPGVPGIGPKFASRLLAGCGSVDTAVADPEAAVAAVGKSVAGKLITDDGLAAIARNRELMTPVRDIPVDLDACRLPMVAGVVEAVLRRRTMVPFAGRAVAALCRHESPPAAARPTPVVVAQPDPVHARPARTCCTPGHEDREASLYPVGVFCPPCVENTARVRLAAVS